MESTHHFWSQKHRFLLGWPDSHLWVVLWDLACTEKSLPCFLYLILQPLYLLRAESLLSMRGEPVQRPGVRKAWWVSSEMLLG